jgi:hypothetical protein
LADPSGRERKGRRPGAAGFTAAPGRARQRRGRRRKEGDRGRLTGGNGLLAKGKEKKKRRAAWAGAGERIAGCLAARSKR